MKLKSALFAGSALMPLLLGGAAFGQAVTPDAGAQPKVDTVVITGSRIARQDYEANSPSVTLGADSIVESGPTQIQQTLDQLPQFGATNGAGVANATAQGRDNANLRGLGIQRTLVLLDGRRMQPSDPLNAIDLNTIPTALLQNVDVITGGASAIYGSDAIAGVVNFRTKQNFTGMQVDLQYGETGKGDGDTVDASIAMGGRTDDGAGHFAVALDYYNRDKVLLATRDFFKRSLIAGVLPGGVILPDAANQWSQASLNSVFVTKYGGASNPTRSQSIGVNLDNTLFTSTAPIINFLGEDSYFIDGNRVGKPLGNDIPLQQPLERYSVYASGGYKLSDHAEVYTQFIHNQYDDVYTREGWAAGTAPLTVRIPVTNPFIPADLKTILASRANPNAPVGFQFNTFRVGETHYDEKNTVDQFLLGIKGDLPISDWTYDVYGSYGTTSLTEVVDGFIDYAAYQSVLDDPTGGSSHCAGGFNPFLPTSLESDPAQASCYAYLNRTLHNNTTMKQQSVEANLQGKVIDLPAGELRFAAGLDYRSNQYGYSPDAQLVATTVMPAQTTGPVHGSTDVSEAFVEALVPVLKDLPFVKELSLDLAYRYSDYDTVGGVGTYAIMGDWQSLDWLRFRGGFQRAIRAPSVGELFAPPAQASTAVGSTASGGGDPCDIAGALRTGANAAQVRALCLATGVPASVVDTFRFIGSAVAGVASGNTALHEETADTYTIGTVIQPHFDAPLFQRLSLSLDYYDISIDGAIGAITGAVSLPRCFNADGSNPTYSPTNYYCQLTTRDNNGNVLLTQQPTLNLAAYKTSGVDLEVDWGFDLGAVGLKDEWGSLDFNVLLSHLDTFKIQNREGLPFLDYAGTIGNTQLNAFTESYPEWKSSGRISYKNGPFSVNLGARWYDGMTNAATVGSSLRQPGVPGRVYADLNGQWQLNDRMTMRAGVLNLNDTEPPRWTGDGVTDAALYDVLGRRFFVGLHVTM